MAGRWVMASIQTSFAIMPAAVYWFGARARARIFRDLDPDAHRLHDAADAALLPVGPCSVSASTWTSLALFVASRILDQPIDIEESRTLAWRAGDVVFDQVWFATKKTTTSRRLVHQPRDDRARRRDRLG
jgi:ATP-binding cassette subfamily B protein